MTEDSEIKPVLAKLYDKLLAFERHNTYTHSVTIASIVTHQELAQELLEALVEEGLFYEGVKIDYDVSEVDISFPWIKDDNRWKGIYQAIRKLNLHVAERDLESLRYIFTRKDQSKYSTPRINLSAEFSDDCQLEKVGEEEVVTKRVIYKRICSGGSFDPIVDAVEPLVVEDFENVSLAEPVEVIDDDIPF